MRSVVLVALAVWISACIQATRQDADFTVPENAPSSFREAVNRARAAGTPIVIDFWAAWCGPCRKLKSETLESPTVAPVLSQVEFVSVDVDAEPELARFYGVSSIPLVLFVDAEGRIVDRLVGFEGPEPFLARLERACSGGASVAAQ